MNYKHIVITGGAGFVGSSLAVALKKQMPEMRVIALDNLWRRGSELNVPRLERAGVEFVRGDVRKPDDFSALPKTQGLLVECSAEPSVLAGYTGSPDYLIHTNLMGCYHCLEYARHTSADIIFVSTSRVYPMATVNALEFTETETRFALADKQTITGASGRGIREDFPFEGARSLYGMTKLAAELMVEEYGDAYKLRWVINRCGLITGPWQMAKSDQGVIALWMAAHCYGKPLSYIGYGGTGKQVRDFLNVQDFCDLILDQVTHFEAYAAQRFNVGGGVENSVSLLELTRLCGEISRKKIAIASVAENRPADLRTYISDCRKVSGIRGWKPKRGAQETLKEIHDWLQAEVQQVRPVIFEEKQT